MSNFDKRTVVYDLEASDDTETLKPPESYSEVELIKFKKCLQVFLIGFNAWVVTQTGLDGSVDRIHLERYICRFLKDDLSVSLGARVNLDEVHDYFYGNEIFLIAMPKCSFSSFRDTSFILDKNGKDMEYGLWVVFDKNSYDYYVEKGPLTYSNNKRFLRQCGFYTECAIS